jgi:hypothetical protein
VRFIRIIVIAAVALTLADCSSRRPLNPPSLVTARDTDMSIQLFMQATILLARYYGFTAIDYEVIRDRSVRHGYEVIPLMAPVSGYATPRLRSDKLLPAKPFDPDAEPLADASHDGLLGYYVNTGLRASQMICRNYMLGLDEANRYIEFLQTEFNIGAGLANAFFILSHANITAMSILHGATVGTNLATDAYQEYRFLAIDRDVALELIDNAQSAIAKKFFDKISGASFADAIQAVSSIEYQCTRSGIRNLLNKAAKAKSVELKDNTEGGTSQPKAKAAVKSVRDTKSSSNNKPNSMSLIAPD